MFFLFKKKCSRVKPVSCRMSRSVSFNFLWVKYVCYPLTFSENWNERSNLVPKL